MISHSLQIIHFHLFMLNVVILYPSSLRLGPSRHGRKLIFIYMYMCGLARLFKRSSSRTAICGRWSSG